MSEKLTAQKKEHDSKRAINAKRKLGFIPVNLYGPGIKDSHSYYLNEIELNRAIKSGKKIHEISSEIGDFKVVFREVQRHPVTWKLLHIDMLSLAPGKRVIVRIPVRYEGIPFGVKNQGGVLIINSRDIRIEAMAEYIPNEITIDVSPLTMRETIHASDVIRENIKVVSPADMLLCRVGITRAAVSAAEGEGAAPAEGAAAAEGAAPVVGAAAGTKTPAAAATPAAPAADAKKKK